MYIFSKLVMMKGKDYTDKVTSIELQYPYVKITLSNGQEYTPKCENTYIADLRGNVNLNGKIVIYNSSPFLDVVNLLDFGKLYRVIFRVENLKYILVNRLE